MGCILDRYLKQLPVVFESLKRFVGLRLVSKSTGYYTMSDKLVEKKVKHSDTKRDANRNTNTPLRAGLIQGNTKHKAGTEKEQKQLHSDLLLLRALQR